LKIFDLETWRFWLADSKSFSDPLASDYRPLFDYLNKKLPKFFKVISL